LRHDSLAVWPNVGVESDSNGDCNAWQYSVAVAMLSKGRGCYCNMGEMQCIEDWKAMAMYVYVYALDTTEWKECRQRAVGTVNSQRSMTLATDGGSVRTGEWSANGAEGRRPAASIE
jgi:hypothetical protein